MRGGCAIFQSMSRNSLIKNNVLMNGPRAGINFNDGMGGGNDVTQNLVLGFVRESADHGNENSWDRVPFLGKWGGEDKPATLAPAWNHQHHNFWLVRDCLC